MKEGVISVIIPVYNAELYLRETIESVLNQSYKSVELLLVNDGSKDGSSAICHEFAKAHDNVKVFDRDNHGVSATRNFGLSHAEGEFIWFCDSDDTIAENAFEIVMREQKEHDADVVIGGMNFCFVSEGKVDEKAVEKKLIITQDELAKNYKEIFSKNYVSSLWNKLIRSSLIKENEITWDETLCLYEDYVFSMDCLTKANKIVCIPNCVYNYMFRNANSLSHRYRTNVAEMFERLYHKISKYLETVGNKSESAFASMNNLMIYIGYECVKNELRAKDDRIKKVKDLLKNETFHEAMKKFKGFGSKYKIVRFLMKNKMARLLKAYYGK
ncbi:MAG: glycosyltransferase family 2 protein [Clostridia bacterium]|nr:glycosyltransferase family 2 protein [Clostridia bacterium]